MAQIKKHLEIEEIIAFSDGNLELLPHMQDHIRNCSKCSFMIRNYDFMRHAVTTNRHISHFPDQKKIEALSDASFKILHGDVTTEKHESSPLSIFIRGWTSSIIKPLTAATAAVLLAAIIYAGFLSTASSDGTMDTPIAASDMERTAVSYEKPEIKISVPESPAVKEKDVVLKTGRSKIRTLAPTYIGMSPDKNSVLMKDGKIKVSVMSGDDFRINIKDRFTVRVLGTSFILDSSSERFSVEVIRGLVEVVDSFDNSVTPLSEKMSKTYQISPEKVEPRPVSAGKKRKIEDKDENERKLFVTPDASFLTQGREALDSGKKGAALQLFIMELERGEKKETALFEVSRIYANEGSNSKIIELFDAYNNVLNSGKLYKEELLIRGCYAQHRAESKDRTFCTQYIDEFPRGYKRNEIMELMNDEK